MASLLAIHGGKTHFETTSLKGSLILLCWSECKRF